MYILYIHILCVYCNKYLYFNYRYGHRIITFIYMHVVTVPVTSRRVPVISEDFKKPPKFSYPNSREISHRRKLPSPLASSYFPVRSEQMIRQCPPPFSLGHSLWGSLACPLLPLFSILAALMFLTRITSTILNSLHSKTLFP